MRTFLIAVAVLVALPATASARLSGSNARGAVRRALQVINEPLRIDHCVRRSEDTVACVVMLTRSDCWMRVRVRDTPKFFVVGIAAVGCRAKTTSG